MVTCGALKCGNLSNKKSRVDVKGWHQVPTHDIPMRKKWLAKMKRKLPDSEEKNFYLCGPHFEDEFFERDLMVSNFILRVCTKTLF